MKYSNCSLFKGIKLNDLESLIKCLQVKEVFYKTGDIISFNNSLEKTLGVLVSGKAFVKKLDRNGNYTILETLIKDSVFSNDFTNYLTDSTFIEIFACENTTVLFMEYENIFKRCKKACVFHSVFVENFIGAIIEKSKILSQRIQILSSKTIKDKILSYANIMAEKVGHKTFTLPMSYISFAEYLCVDRSAMMRELKKLNEQGVLRINKKEITVLSDKYI